MKYNKQITLIIIKDGKVDKKYNALPVCCICILVQ